MSARCSDACGHCGRCTADWENDTEYFICIWCGDKAPDIAGEGYWPYCSSLCASRAETDSLED